MTKDGIQLEVKNPLDWILYNIQHVEHTQNGYKFDWHAIQEKVKQIHLSIGNQWIAEIQQTPDYFVLTDVFGNCYYVRNKI